MQKFIAANPSEPFIEFLHYALGNFDTARAVNSNSPIKDVLEYASAFKIIESIAQDAVKIAKPRIASDEPEPEGLLDRWSGMLGLLNSHPEYYDYKPLATVVPTFAERAAAAQKLLEAVLQNPSARHADDAAYLLGWLAFHQGKSEQALAYLSKAMTLGNFDYKQPAAMKQSVRILELYAPQDQLRIVESDKAFALQPALWYVAARSAYRTYNYRLAVEIAEKALHKFGISLERLPVTTDPSRIEPAIKKLNGELSHDPNFLEIPYLNEASKEILQYQDYLDQLEQVRPAEATKRARAIVMKYSKLTDDLGREGAQPRRARDPAHKDLRQALHLIDITLQRAPKSAEYSPLREWLYYRRIRALVEYAPKNIAGALAAMEVEYPKSDLLDDALAEQLYAEGMVLGDFAAAERTFRKLTQNFPRSNAIDNAYNWMAVIYTRAGRTAEATHMNCEIMHMFPFTRFAGFAKERLAKAKARCS
jgi:TolA-binding protein